VKKKKLTLRKCIGCGQQFGKKEMIRIVKNKENNIEVDFAGKAHGRGAYVCPNEECIEKLRKSKALNRAFSMEVKNEIYDIIIDEIRKNVKE
jgi:hypothetical protein